jgi:SAM-dependent methyltransferase
MKKKTDTGLLYMQKLGIRPARDLAGFRSALVERIGRDAADKLRQLNAKRMSTGLSEDSLAFYAYKNSSLRISTIFSGLYDGDLFRRSCNWIHENLAYFGESILDVGCDDGIISCFLASSLPGSRILSIDNNASASSVSRQLADKLGLANIEFIIGDVSSLPLDLKFDTVFSMRTIHENVDYSGYPTYARFSEKGDFYGDRLHVYAESLAARVRDSGILISIERGDRAELLLGWLYALNKAGMLISSDRTDAITASELGEEFLFQAAVRMKSDNTDPTDKPYIYGIWHTLTIKKIDSSATEYHGWEAEVRFDDLAGKRLRRITYRDTCGYVDGIIELWTCVSRDDTLLVFNKVKNRSFLYLYSAGRLDELIGMLQTHKRDTISRGFAAEEDSS